MLILAAVAECERPAFVAASEQLREALEASAPDAPAIRLEFCERLGDVDANREPTVAVASLLRELDGPDEPSTIEERLRQQLSSVLARGARSAFVCTIFRYVADDPALRTTERIRRLNLLAAELSLDTGACVIDVDRVFAHIGAHQLKTDHRLGGRLAAEAAGHTIVASLLAVGLEEIVPVDVREKAQAFQGSVWDLARLLQRRIPMEQGRAG